MGIGIGIGVPFSSFVSRRLAPSYNGTDQYATLDSPWSPTGDSYSVSFTALIDVGGNISAAIISDFNENINWLRLDSVSKFLDYKIGGGSSSKFNESVINAGELLEVTVSANITADTIDATVNGVQLTQETGAGALTPIFNAIAYKNSSFFGGLIYDIALTDNADSTNSRFYPCNETSGSVCFDSLNPQTDIQTEDILDVSNWSAIHSSLVLVGSEIKVTSNNTAQHARGWVDISGLTVGDSYNVTVIARRGSQGTGQRFRSWSFCSIPNTLITSTTNESYSFIVVATQTSGQLKVYTTTAGIKGDEVFVSSISVVRVTDATLINSPPRIEV